MAGRGINDSHDTDLSPVCEIEVSSQCPSGWVHYVDDGSEGLNSCLYLSRHWATSWSEANTACSTLAAGAHLATVLGTGQTTKLMAFVASLAPGVSVYMGCSQSPSATQRGAGWSWVDGTNAANLNCGSGNGGEGCGVWNAGTSEPK